MGCDIHLLMERRLNGAWVPVNPKPHEGPIDYLKEWPWGAWTERNQIEELAQAALPLEERVPSKAQYWAFGRNYGAFGQLSGVRGYGPPFIEPRGVPFDASPQVLQEADCVDWHTPGWYTLEELQDGIKRWVHPEKRIKQLVAEMVKVAKRYKLQPSEVRVVMWYDN